MPSKLILILAAATLLPASVPDTVRVDTGRVRGAAHNGVTAFKGIPFAAPPVGTLRWKAPLPAPDWKGVRDALEFGPRCMQGNIYNDMIFRDKGPSEDCLYLNVWTPAASPKARLPVMVWIYGGGFAAGATSEPRQDGGNLAKKGVVVVSMNYRLGLFGFFAHADLAKESGKGSSGNYGLLDQVAALQWVHRNVDRFGGDPAQVTIFGESAGSFSVSALMASPLAQGLFQRAIGESGAFFSTVLNLKRLAESEEADAKFADSIGAHSLDELRAKPAADLLAAATRQGAIRFAPNVDGYFLPQTVREIFAAGKQSHVPLLAGWNRDEGGYRGIFGKDDPTAANYEAFAKKRFAGKAGEFLKLYPGASDEQAKRSAQDLAGDQFIAFSTWKWLEMQGATGGSRLYRYEFDDAPPTPANGEEHGAYHSAEIEFVFGALASKDLPWRPEDKALSDLLSTYWSNFAKKGDPNGAGLPEWPVYSSQNQYQVMHLDATSHAAPDDRRARYEFLDQLK
ncbi:MAG TPA: carboxylesterase/lipase family protein [Bryobacteraceae bacterium]|nr:carboxylesterase/lipase family protein [Bryobacteraceae bacterium]